MSLEKSLRKKTVDGGYLLTKTDLPSLTQQGYVFVGWNKAVGDIVNGDKTTIIEGTICYDNLSKPEDLTYGDWGDPFAGNYGNVSYVLVGTKLAIFGEGVMIERTADDDVYKPLGEGLNENSEVANITECYVDDWITSIGNGAFYGAANLTKITGCRDVEKICIHAFSGTGFEEISGFDDVTIVESNAFSNCHALKKVNGLNSVNEIEGGAFIDCPELKTLTGFKSITQIYSGTLEEEYNPKFTDFYFGVTKIGWEDFYGCNLSEITILNKDITFDSYTMFLGYEVGSSVLFEGTLNFAGSLENWQKLLGYDAELGSCPEDVTYESALYDIGIGPNFSPNFNYEVPSSN